MLSDNLASFLLYLLAIFSASGLYLALMAASSFLYAAVERNKPKPTCARTSFWMIASRLLTTFA